MSLASVGVLAIALAGALVMAIGFSLMTNFRGATTWWKESAAEFLGVAPDRVFGAFSERSMRLVVGGAFALGGSIMFLIAIIHV